MTAHVRRTIQYSAGTWAIYVKRDQETDLPYQQPPFSDLPADIREALVQWTQSQPPASTV